MDVTSFDSILNVLLLIQIDQLSAVFGIFNEKVKADYHILKLVKNRGLESCLKPLEQYSKCPLEVLVQGYSSSPAVALT